MKSGPRLEEILDLPKNSSALSRKEIDEIDFKGKDAFRESDFKEAMLNRARAAFLYQRNNLFYEAANSADWAAQAAFICRSKKSKYLELAIFEARLNELAGDCYARIKDWRNTAYAYLKAAKRQILDWGNKKKAQGLFKRSKFLFKEYDLEVSGLYREVEKLINN